MVCVFGVTRDSFGLVWGFGLGDRFPAPGSPVALTAWYLKSRLNGMAASGAARAHPSQLAVSCSLALAPDGVGSSAPHPHAHPTRVFVLCYFHAAGAGAGAGGVTPAPAAPVSILATTCTGQSWRSPSSGVRPASSATTTGFYGAIGGDGAPPTAQASVGADGALHLSWKVAVTGIEGATRGDHVVVNALIGADDAAAIVVEIMGVLAKEAASAARLRRSVERLGTAVSTLAGCAALQPETSEAVERRNMTVLEGVAGVLNVHRACIRDLRAKCGEVVFDDDEDMDDDVNDALARLPGVDEYDDGGGDDDEGEAFETGTRKRTAADMMMGSAGGGGGAGINDDDDVVRIEDSEDEDKEEEDGDGGHHDVYENP